MPEPEDNTNSKENTRIVEIRRVEKPKKKKPVLKPKANIKINDVKQIIDSFHKSGSTKENTAEMLTRFNLNGCQDEALQYLNLVFADRPNEIDTLRQRSEGRYYILKNEIWWIRHERNGEESPIKLCNFTAKITEDIYKDNGVEESRFLKIIGTLAGGVQLRQIEISSSSFKSLNWIIDYWGIEPQLEVGQNIGDHLRRAIGYNSYDFKKRKVFTHTGWREIDGQKAFLIGSGSINGNGVEAEMDNQLNRYRMPAVNLLEEGVENDG